MIGLAWGLAGFVVVLAVLLWRFRVWKASALARLAAGSRVVETDCGPLEYAEVGSGPAILVCHGALGGYDQGLLVAQRVGGIPFRFIAVSRSGYLRTPLASGRSPEEQADALAALLRALGIERAAAIGISAAGPSVLQFALRHPDQCWAVVLLSAVTKPLVARRPPAAALPLLNRAADVGAWLAALLSRWKPHWVLRPLGNRQDMAKPPDATLMEPLRALVSSLLPIRARWAGLMNDADQLATLPAYRLEGIRVPTLVVHGTADGIVPFAHAQFAAAAISGAQLVEVRGGSHLASLMNGDMVRSRAFEFLVAHSP